MTVKIFSIAKFFLKSVFLVFLATNPAWSGEFDCTGINEGYKEFSSKKMKFAYTNWKLESKDSSPIINYKKGQGIQLSKNGRLVVDGFADGAFRYSCNKNFTDIINAPRIIGVSSTNERWWLWPRPLTENQAAFVSGQLLGMGGKLNYATGAISDVPVANGFLNMDNQGVVTYIGEPDLSYRGPYEHLITSASTTQKNSSSGARKASKLDNDEVVKGMIADAKKLAEASPGNCVDIFPDEVNQKGADYKLVYLPKRNFKSFESMEACLDYMLARGTTGTSLPEMAKKAEVVLVERIETELQTPLFKRCLRVNSNSDPVFPYDCFLTVYTGWLESQVPDWKTNMTDPGIILREPVSIVNLSREMILKGAISIQYAEKLTIERLMNSDTDLENWHQGHLALEAKQRAEKFKGFLNAIIGFGIASGKINSGIPSGAFGGGDPAITGNGASRLVGQKRGLYGLECSYCCRGGRQYSVILQANDICPAIMN